MLKTSKICSGFETRDTTFQDLLELTGVFCVFLTFDTGMGRGGGQENVPEQKTFQEIFKNIHGKFLSYIEIFG